MIGKICIVTGANAGIGKATALGLAQRGATVVMVCRSRERGAAAKGEIMEKTGNQSVDMLLADLSSQAAIRHLAADFQQRYSSLHVLINNAGIIPQTRTVTEDGLEMQLAVNHLAYFLLTNLLLDLLKASAPARIMNVSSGVHAGATIDFDDLQSERAYRPSTVYGRTKLMNVLFTYELARRLQGTAVTANCLHPGVIATKLNRDYMGGASLSGYKASDASLAEGAKTSLYLATAPEVAGVSGQYFSHQRPASSSAVSHDEALSRRLWAVSAKLVGLPLEGDWA
jgi:NAD(P)-dependent dehydrogenase (short-subunit alcohol dehydrogenase family)